MRLIEKIAHSIQAYHNCLEKNNQKWATVHLTELLNIEKNDLPSGAGFDNGSKILVDESSSNRIVFETAFHHMNEHGFYDGWTNHTVIVRPDFVLDLDVSVKGNNRNQIKDYIAEYFQQILLNEV